MVGKATPPKEWVSFTETPFWIFSCLDGVPLGCPCCQSPLCVVPAVTWAVEALGMRHSLAQVPFFLHLDVSKLVLYLMSEPASEAPSQSTCPVFASLLLLKPSPTGSSCAVVSWGKVRWWYQEGGSLRLGRMVGLGGMRALFK